MIDATGSDVAAVGALLASAATGLAASWTWNGRLRSARTLGPAATLHGEHAQGMLRRRRRQRGPVPRMLRRSVVGVIGACWLLLAGPLPFAAVAAGVVAYRRGRPIIDERRSRRRIELDTPEALDLFVLLLDAGLPVRRCIDELARRGPSATRAGFADVTSRLERGAPLAEAIVALRHRLGAGVTGFVDLIAASDRSGMPMSTLVHQISSEARATRIRRNQAAARVLPIKLSFPLVTCTLPSFVLLAIAPAVMGALSSLSSHAW